MISSSDDESFTEVLKQGLQNRQTKPSNKDSLLSLSSDEEKVTSPYRLPTSLDSGSDSERPESSHSSSDELGESFTTAVTSINSRGASAEKSTCDNGRKAKERGEDKKKNVVESSDDEEDAYENFLNKMKNTRIRILSSSGSLEEPAAADSRTDSDDPDTSVDGFIVPDDASISEGSVTDDDESVFYLKTTNLLDKKTKPSADVQVHLQSYSGVSLYSSDLEEPCTSDVELSPLSSSDSEGEAGMDGKMLLLSASEDEDEQGGGHSKDSKSATESIEGLIELSDSSSDESFEMLLKEGLEKRKASINTPARKYTGSPSKHGSNISTPAVEGTKLSHRIDSRTPGAKKLQLTPSQKLRTLMESDRNNSNISLPSLSEEDDDDDVIIVSESINTPAPVRRKPARLVQTQLTPAGQIKTSSRRTGSHGASTPANNRSKMLDSIHTNFTRTEPRLRKPPATQTRTQTAGFIASLSKHFDENQTRHPDAIKYIKNFKQSKEELVERLSQIYNDTVFEGKLSDVKVTFNKRLLKTAGLCKYMSTRTHKTKQAEVELSEKVCDTSERVRDTLIHEMCHAAVWIINETQDGHGRYWQYWARKAELSHKELPPIRRCHSYDITTKYIYKCTKCGQQIGRHSKSLDIERKVCGICKGRFELLTQGKNGLQTPAKTPNKFALFVKENYASVKKSGSLSHKEVMSELSSAFSKNLRL